MPGAGLIHVKLRPASMTVIFQNAGGNFGWRMVAVLPTASGPRSRTLFTDGVHSCHRSTSLITCQTRSGGAAISTLMLNCLTTSPATRTTHRDAAPRLLLRTLEQPAVYRLAEDVSLHRLHHVGAGLEGIGGRLHVDLGVERI